MDPRKKTDRKGSLILVLGLSLLSLSCSSSDKWVTHYMRTGEENYDSSKICYPAYDRVNGIDVEIIRVQGRLYTYLHVHSQEIPPYAGNPKEAFISLLINGEIMNSTAFRHEGGQRVLLSDETQKILISNLQTGKAVTISLQGFSTAIPPEHFTSHFAELHKTPLRNPFQLPFTL